MSRVLQDALNAFSEYMGDNETPACFSKEEYKIWCGLEAEAPTLPVRRFICRDCNPEYSKQMIRENRCFMRVWNAEIEGFDRIPVEKIAD